MDPNTPTCEAGLHNGAPAPELLLTVLADGGLVLTPNFRSSDQLIEWSRQPALVQPRPAILAIDLWLRDLWTEAAQRGTDAVLEYHLLTPAEELLLWRQVVTEASPGLFLLDHTGAAASAADGWRLLQQWCLSLHQLRAALRFGGTTETADDCEIAWRWFSHFERLCQQKKVLAFSSMLQILLGLLQQPPHWLLPLLPRRLLLWGFDAPPPLYQAVFSALQAQSTLIEVLTLPTAQPLYSLEEHADPDAECQAAAQWAEQILQEQPAARIGIVCPEAELLRGPLRRHVEARFAARPALLASTLGSEVADLPLVKTALLGLALLDEQIDLLTLGILLRSPFVTGQDAEALDCKAALEWRLRRQGAVHCSLFALRAHCRALEASTGVSALSTALENIQQHLRRQPVSQSFSQWLTLFEKIWQELLPRPLLLENAGAEAIAAWDDWLRQAHLASSLFDSLERREAIERLASLARALPVLQRRSGAAILLLTPAMAAGLRFSHIWCLQMSDSQWPLAETPHPLLPLHFQRQHGMPGTDKTGILARSRRLLDQLAGHCSRELVFSLARMVDDQLQKPTPLLPARLQRRAPPTCLVPAALHPALREAGRVAAAAESCSESMLLPLAGEQAIEGGSRLLRDQSNCPFKAYATHRLQARELHEPYFGVPARAVGDCVHDALRGFWAAVRDQGRLLSLGEAELLQEVTAAVQPALAKLAKAFPAHATVSWQKLEAARLRALLLQWLEVERKRGPFEVAMREQQVELDLRPLRLMLKIDRVDRQPDGSLVVVDYKTGLRKSIDWQAKRPRDPQLLLYQVAVDQQSDCGSVAALLHAGVNVEKPDYAGIAADEQAWTKAALPRQIKNHTPAWSALKAQWELSLRALAEEFAEGLSAVHPQHRTSCDHCHLAALCRIDEVQGERSEDDDEEETGP